MLFLPTNHASQQCTCHLFQASLPFHCKCHSFQTHLFFYRVIRVSLFLLKLFSMLIRTTSSTPPGSQPPPLFAVKLKLPPPPFISEWCFKQRGGIKEAGETGEGRKATGRGWELWDKRHELGDGRWETGDERQETRDGRCGEGVTRGTYHLMGSPDIRQWVIFFF